VEKYAIHRFDIKAIITDVSRRPVLDLTFALNYYFGKLDVFGYHLVNLLLHIANGVMLYFILLWTMQKSEEQRAEGEEQRAEGEEQRAEGGNISAMSYELRAMNYYSRIPLYASLIFIAHPVQTQAVTYIVSRSALLATFFYLLSLLLFIRGCRAQGGEQRADRKKHYALRTLPYFGGAFIAAYLGMGSKQIAATIPLMLLLYDFYFISDGNFRTLIRHYRVHLAMFLPITLFICLNFSGIQRFIAFDHAGDTFLSQDGPLTSLQYFFTQLHVIPYYIKLLFVPVNQNLDYDWPVTRSIDIPTILFFILLASIIILAVKMFRKHRLASFGILWFFIALSVESSFFVIDDVIFEHRLYLPSIGFAIVLALLIGSISGAKRAENNGS
jgi:hypothetical protein